MKNTFLQRIARYTAVAVALLAPMVTTAASLVPECALGFGNCTTCDFIDLFARVAGFLSTLIGIVVLLMFIIGGVMWIISMGKPEGVERGQKIIVGALIGMVLVAGGYSMVNVTIAAFMNQSILDNEEVKLFGQPEQWNVFCATEAVAECKEDTPYGAPCVCSGAGCEEDGIYACNENHECVNAKVFKAPEINVDPNTQNNNAATGSSSSSTTTPPPSSTGGTPPPSSTGGTPPPSSTGGTPPAEERDPFDE